MTDPLEPPIFMLNCTADGPVQTINVMMSITEEIEFAIQNTEIHINCSNGYHANVCIYIIYSYWFDRHLKPD